MTKKTLIPLLLMVVLSNLSVYTSIAQAESDEIIPFIYGNSTSTPAFDPQNFYDTTSSNVAINHLEGLYAFNYTDPKMGLIPRLAKDMGSWNDAGTEWTIELRQDVYWHDGTKFTANDVKWNWDRLYYLAAEHLSKQASLWYNDDGDLMLKSTEIIDDYTIKFVLNKPWMDFYYLQSNSVCFMIKPVEGKEEAIIENEDFELINGTGPFILQNFIAGDKTVLTANNDYYRGGPDIQKLIFQVFADSIAYNRALMTQECHVIRHVRSDNRAIFKTDPDLSYGIQQGLCCYFYHLNVINIPWAARKAMQYAFNYEYTIENVYDNQVVEQHHPVPDGMIGYNPSLPRLPYYDLNISRQYLLDDPLYSVILASHGITDLTASDDDWKAVAISNTPVDSFNFTHYGTGTVNQLIDNMKYVGIEIIDNVVGDWGTTCLGLKVSLEIVMGGWCPDYFHPINQIEPLFGTSASSNYCELANATIDNMMNEAHSVSGSELESKIDEIVTAIIVEQAAAMYFLQNFDVPGWSSKYVSNVNDLFNPNLDKYFYSMEFALSEKQPPTRSGINIPGYSLQLFMPTLICIILILYIKSEIQLLKEKK